MFLSHRLTRVDERVVRCFYRCRNFSLECLLDNLSSLAVHQAHEFALLRCRFMLGKPSQFDVVLAFAYNIGGR